MARVSLSTQITRSVDLRLRMLALVKGEPLSHVLVSLLDQALPPAAELTSQLGSQIASAALETEAAA